MAHVETKEGPLADRVDHVELVAADRAGFDTDTEELAFDGIDHLCWVLRVCAPCVERRFKTCPCCHAVDWDIFVAVGHPDIIDRRRTKHFAHLSGDLAGAAAMFDPEISDALVGVAEGQVIVGLLMREESGIEIEPDILVLGPIDPWSEVTVLKLWPTSSMRRQKIVC